MSVSNKIKALLKLKGKDNAGLAEYLGISSQALSNKFYRNSFSANDLINVSEYMECELAFIVDESQKIILDSWDKKE